MTKPAVLTPRSVALLEAEGYRVANVEKYNHITRRKTDLFGFLDLLAIRRGEVLGVQVTSASHHADRRTKIADHENVGAVRESGMRIELHSWDKGPNGRWRCRREDLS